MHLFRCTNFLYARLVTDKYIFFKAKAIAEQKGQCMERETYNTYHEL